MAFDQRAGDTADPPDGHDHDLARGMDQASRIRRRGSPCWRNRELVIFRAAVVAFHYANAAMLPLVSGLLALHNRERERLMSSCIVRRS